MLYLLKALMNLFLIILFLTITSQNALASRSFSLDSTIENFTRNLTNQIRELVTEATNNSIGSTASIANVTDTNASNIVSNRVVVSNNNSLTQKVGVSTQITTINGVCTSNITGGLGSETLSSNGVCNDLLTGGAGADAFVCGEGDDIIRDYNATEGDRLVDKENCETVQ